MDAPSSLSTWTVILRTIGFLFLTALARFFYRLHQVRTMTRRFHKENGLEMIPHSYLLGHLIESGKLLAPFPSDMFPINIATLFLQQYPQLEKNGFIVIDSWPFLQPMIFVFDPDLSAQFTQIRSLPKSWDIKFEFRPLTQNKDLVTMEGAEWKLWRSIFNPGFSAKNLMSLTPIFLEEIRTFVDILREAAKSGEVMRLEEPAINLTFDVIGRAVLDTRLECQKTKNPLQWALEKQISWLTPELTPPSLLKLINPARPLLMWYYNRVIRNYLLPIIHQNIAAKARGGETKTKTVVSLAANAYLAEKQADLSSNSTGPIQVDKTFINMAIPQLVIFLFAGHDTTAVTLCFAYHLLCTNPSTLARLRAEHDAVLGPDPSQTEALLTQNPQLLNALPYTAAVVRETLRLFAPAATVRQGQPDFELVHPQTGNRYPTDGFVVHQNSNTTHHLESIFPRPLEFLPERFLAAEGEPLHVRKNSFRPFELGPRGCIGQELAILELKMILARTVREFDIESAYAEKLPIILGQSTYQVGNVTGHPKGGMPVRVRMRARE